MRLRDNLLVSSGPTPLSRLSCHRWAAILLLTCLLLAGCTGARTNDQAGAATNSLPVESPQVHAETPLLVPVETATSQPRLPVTIAAVGDIMLARSVGDAITPGQPDGPFAHLRGVLRGADLTVGNLECAISDGGTAEPKSYTFRASPLAAIGLAGAGFDLVSLANNHTLDFGPDAFLDTMDALTHVSIEEVGAGPDDEHAYRSRVLTANGVRVAFLAMAEVPNEAGYNMLDWTATDKTAGIAWVDEERLAATIHEAAGAADIVVVMFHFGIEGSSEPSGRQRELAHAAIDAGANLVLGSHPHVMQEVEEYGDGLIAYSLGNFVFDGFEGAANDTGILLVTFAPDGSISWRVEPMRIGWDGLPRARD